jgi:L-ascorbate metabolism protein UlaG (beta-lactamase superfamily)
MTKPLRRIGGAVLTLALVAVLAGIWLWNDRVDLASLNLPTAQAGTTEGGAVTVTWLGVTTLLFDDGETRLLTDGFFSRPGVIDLALDRSVAPDRENIERALRDAGISNLAAIMTVHSHFDHAMDTAEVAKRTGAVVLGSASTANLARGAGLAEERIVDWTDGGSRSFGRFTVTFIRSRHMPIDADGNPPFPGTVDAPLVPPAPISAWREGGSYSIVIAHPRGTALVQGSAGYVEGALDGVRADVVLLGIAGLARNGHDYTQAYWREIVGRTGARRVLPIHHDDFTRPYGEVIPFPRIVDDLETSVAWLRALAVSKQPAVTIELLPWGDPVVLF